MGSFQFEKKKSPGRPILTVNTANIQRVRLLIEEDCRLSCREQTKIPKTCVHDILTVHLNLRNVYAVWVPHMLSETNKEASVAACTGLKTLFEDKGMAYMGSNYIIEDESWFNWDSKENIRVWTKKKAKKPTNVKEKLTRRKTMVTIAFTCKPNRFSVSLIPQGESINAEYMIQYLKETGKRFHNLKKDKISLKEMHFQMDNARPHTAAATQHFLASRNVNLVKQLPY